MSSRAEPGSIEVVTARGTVLVVDDDERVADSIALGLCEENDVTVTTSARQALALILSGARFDLILCDLMMPEMSGMDFYAEVVRVAPAVVGSIVFMTGGAFTPRATAFVEGLEAGYLEKPLASSELRDLVRARVSRGSAS